MRKETGFKVGDKVKNKKTGVVTKITRITSKSEYLNHCYTHLGKDEKDEVWYLTFNGDYSKIDDYGYLLEDDIEIVSD